MSIDYETPRRPSAVKIFGTLAISALLINIVSSFMFSVMIFPALIGAILSLICIALIVIKRSRIARIVWTAWLSLGIVLVIAGLLMGQARAMIVALPITANILSAVCAALNVASIIYLWDAKTSNWLRKRRL